MTATLKLKPYQRVVAATGLSNLADGVRFVALPLLALDVTSSPFFLTAVVAASMAPWLVFGLWAGSLTDRLDRRALAQRTALLRVGLLSPCASPLLQCCGAFVTRHRSTEYGVLFERGDSQLTESAAFL